MSKTLKRQFTDWVRKQDADETYDYMDLSQCAIMQFAETVVGRSWPDKQRLYMSLVRTTDMQKLACSKPWTFGALLTRLEASEAVE